MKSNRLLQHLKKELAMAHKDYHFITHWRVQGVVKDVTNIISDRKALTRWWPSVYLKVEELEPGDADGVGTVMRLHTKGWLPYTLRWQLRIAEIYKNGFLLVASGDFEGRGIWTFKQVGEEVDITYDWKISAEKSLLRYFSFIMKPIFAANHYWAMARGEESLKLELARRKATTAEERAHVPAPPQSTSNPSFLLSLVCVGFVVIGGLGYLLTKMLDKA